MKRVKVLLFATLRERAGGKKFIELDLPDGVQVGRLKAEIAGQYPALKESMRSVLVAVDHEYASDEKAIEAGSEVALFPPVSGGAGDPPTVFAITEDLLDLDGLLAKITLKTTGAAAIFTGMVRGVTTRSEAVRDGGVPPHGTEYLEYEAYQPMAEKKMRQIADEIRRKWPSVEGIAIVQRIGRLFPGTPTVLIACTAAHRDTGVFDAARYGIDHLKEIVPIWKKEVSPDGTEWIEGEYVPKQGE